MSTGGLTDRATSSTAPRERAQSEDSGSSGSSKELLYKYSPQSDAELFPWDRKIRELYRKAYFSSMDADPAGAFIKVPFLLHLAVFWSLGLSYLLLDITRPAFLEKYKIQATRLTPALLRRLFKRLILTHVLLLGVPTLAALRAPKKIKEPMQAYARAQLAKDPPKLHRIVLDVLFSLSVEEIFFYFSHRALHNKRWYKHCHKEHHLFKAPIALAAEYAHPFEFVVSNLIPGALGPLIGRQHPVSMWAWLVTGVAMTCQHHSGWLWPFLPQYERDLTLKHDFHHNSFYYQLGVTGHLDKVFNTAGGDLWKRYAETALQRAAGKNIARLSS